MTKNLETGRYINSQGVELDLRQLEKVSLVKAGVNPKTKKQSSAWMAGFNFGAKGVKEWRN